MTSSESPFEKDIEQLQPQFGKHTSSEIDLKEDSSNGEVNHLSRSLKNRHIALISIGGVIGTGLFLGIASSLANGGPLGLFLGFFIVGTICYSVMISIGEMVTLLPIPGGHIKLAERFVDPALSFTLGWFYWYNWTIGIPAELSALAVLMQFWKSPDDVSPAVWITMGLVIVVFINLLGVGVYGECEFIFASIKVITIVGLIILGIVLDLGGGPSHDRIGFRYWRDPGPLVQYMDIPGAKGRFLGWWAVMSQSAFSYIGSEIIAIAAGEAKNPRRNIPKAISRVYVRLLLFYLGGTFVVGLLVPSNHPDLGLTTSTGARSPFVIAIKSAGIRGLPSVINTAIMTSAWSAASSDLYVASRAIYGLALGRNAPRIFRSTTRGGLPLVAIAFTACFSLLAYMSVSSGSGKVFQWFVNMCSVAGLMNWFSIVVTYTRFHKGLVSQGIDRSRLPYHHKLNPYAAWYAVIACPTICLFQGYAVFLRDNWDTATFVTSYLPFVLYPIVYFGARVFRRVSPVRPEEMDFVTGQKEAEDSSYDEPPPRNIIERFWSWLTLKKTAKGDPAARTWVLKRIEAILAYLGNIDPDGASAPQRSICGINMASFAKEVLQLMSALEGLRLSSYVDSKKFALCPIFVTEPSSIPSSRKLRLIGAYDYLLTFEDERTLMWTRRWSPTKGLFFMTRYLPFIDLSITASHHFRKGMTPAACNLAYQIAGCKWLIDIGFLTAECILLIRTWAIWNRGRWIGLVLIFWAALALVANFVVMGLFMKSIGFSALPTGLSGCLVTSGNSLIMGVWIILMVYEAGIVVLMVLKGVQLYRELGRTGLFLAVFRDGAIFYVYIFVLSVANVIVVSRLSRDLSTMLASIERVLHSILTQRLLFALRRAGSEPEVDESEKLETMKFDESPRAINTTDTETGTGTVISSFSFN
ncbi:hypothetical protein ACEPAI_222 [Sanghuangporus weigelae]